MDSARCVLPKAAYAIVGENIKMRPLLAVLVISCLALMAPASASNATYARPNYHHAYPSYSGAQYLPAAPGKRPPCAGQSDTFCTKIDYYPTEVIEYLVKRYSFDFKTLLQDESMEPMMMASSNNEGQTMMGTMPPPPPPAPANVSYPRYTPPVKPAYVGPNGKLDAIEPWWVRYMRPGSRRPMQPTSGNYRAKRQTSNDEKLCPTTSAFITPRAAVNTRGNWMFVVNLESDDQQTRQLVQTERCATTRCSGLCQVPAGFTTSCEQQFVQKRLVALNGNGESLYTDTFWFPHCCVCRIRSNN